MAIQNIITGDFKIRNENGILIAVDGIVFADTSGTIGTSGTSGTSGSSTILSGTSGSVIVIPGIPTTTTLAPTTTTLAPTTTTTTVASTTTTTTTLAPTTTTTTAGSPPMILTFNIANSGDSLTLPFSTSPASEIYWGDGSSSLSKTHTYTTAGNYDVILTGTSNGFNYFNYGNPGGNPELKDIKQWGTFIAPSDWSGLFYNCYTLTGISATDNPTFTSVTNISNMFKFCNALGTTTTNIEGWDLSGITNTSGLFYGALAFNKNISSWNVSSVTNMESMFRAAALFNQPIGSWNVGNVTNMGLMFYAAQAFNQNISSWNVSQVTDMQTMFANSAFNQNIGNWNVGNVTNMQALFSTTPFNQNIGNWNVSNVTIMNNMFYGASAFNQNISGWNVSNVGAYLMTGMFNNASAFNQDLSTWCVTNTPSMPNLFATGATSWVLPKPVWGTCPTSTTTTTTTIVVSSAIMWYASNSPITGYNDAITACSTNTSAPFSIQIYWAGVGSPLGQIIYTDAGLTNPIDLNFSKYYYIADYSQAWFFDGSTLASVYDCATTTTTTTAAPTTTTTTISPNAMILTFNVANDGDTIILPYDPTPTYSGIINWGDGTTSVNSYANRAHTYTLAGNYDISITGTIGYMLNDKTGTSIDRLINIKQWGTVNVGSYFGFFSGATNLTGISATDAPIFSGDLTSMFGSCYLLGTTTTNVSHWNTSSIYSMESMFSLCQNFNGNISNWNTSNVVTMRTMFSFCFAFNQNIGSWNVANVTNMYGMFGNATSFNQDLSGWCVTNIPTEPSYFYYGSTNWTLPKPVWGTCP